MRPFLFFLGMGTSLIASQACGARPQRPLAAAAVSDAVDEVRRLLEAGDPPDDADTHGLTPLMWAARDNALAAMAVLLDAGANVNARDTNNHWTPLLHAIHKQRPPAVSVLLERGADPNAAAPGGIAPILMAADDADPAMVRLLLAHGANPRIEGPGGVTPLTQAVSGGAMTDFIDRPLLGGCHPATVRALLAHDPGLRVAHDAAGLQAIWWARFHGCEEVLHLIGERPTNPGQTIVSGVGILRQELREKPRDGSAPTPATGDPSRR